MNGAYAPYKLLQITILRRGKIPVKKIQLSKTIGFCFFATVLSIPVASAGTCERISGVYSESAAVVLGADGKTLNVVIAYGDRPNAYGSCVDGKISVIFTDDIGCCTGEFDGKSIKWDNGTTWNKNRP